MDAFFSNIAKWDLFRSSQPSTPIHTPACQVDKSGTPCSQAIQAFTADVFEVGWIWASPALVLPVILSLASVQWLLRITWSYRHRHASNDPQRRFVCGGNPPSRTRRTVVGRHGVSVYGWPTAKGGVVVLDDVSAVDLDFLQLDRLDPPAARSAQQARAQGKRRRRGGKAEDENEDELCRRLLRLGGTWWEGGVSRYDDVRWALEWHPQALDKMRRGVVARPTRRERRWVRVGWPTDGSGMWVAEFDSCLPMTAEDGEQVPLDETPRLYLVRDMDEKCQVLRHRFKARYFERIEDYDGYGCLNWWDDESESRDNQQ